MPLETKTGKTIVIKPYLLDPEDMGLAEGGYIDSYINYIHDGKSSIHAIFISYYGKHIGSYELANLVIVHDAEQLDVIDMMYRPPLDKSKPSGSVVPHQYFMDLYNYSETVKRG